MKGYSSSFEQSCIPFAQEWFVPSLFEISYMHVEKNKNLKSLLTDWWIDRQTTVNKPSEKLTWAFSSNEPTVKGDNHLSNEWENNSMQSGFIVKCSVMMNYQTASFIYKHTNSVQKTSTDASILVHVYM